MQCCLFPTVITWFVSDLSNVIESVWIRLMKLWFFFFCETWWMNMICPILVGFVILNEWVNVVYFLQFISSSDYYGRLFVCKHHGDYLDLGCWITVIYHLCEVLKWVTGICNRVTFMRLGDNREVGFDWSRQAALTGAHLNFKWDEMLLGKEMLLWKSATRLFSLIHSLCPLSSVCINMSIFQ